MQRSNREPAAPTDDGPKSTAERADAALARFAERTSQTKLNQSEVRENAEAQAEVELDMAAQRAEIEREFEEQLEAERVDLFKIIQEAPENFPLEAGLWNVLIEMVRPKAKMGRFIKTQAQIEAEQYQTVIGRVLKVGPTASTGETEGKIPLHLIAKGISSAEELLGWYVIIQRYVGNEVYFAPLPAKKLRFIAVTEILGVTRVPTMWMRQ